MVSSLVSSLLRLNLKETLCCLKQSLSLALKIITSIAHCFYELKSKCERVKLGITLPEPHLGCKCDIVLSQNTSTGGQRARYITLTALNGLWDNTEIQQAIKTTVYTTNHSHNYTIICKSSFFLHCKIKIYTIFFFLNTRKRDSKITVLLYILLLLMQLQLMTSLYLALMHFAYFSNYQHDKMMFSNNRFFLRVGGVFLAWESVNSCWTGPGSPTGSVSTQGF